MSHQGDRIALDKPLPHLPLNRPLPLLPPNRDGQPSSNSNLGGDGLMPPRSPGTPSSHSSDGNTSATSSVSPPTRGRQQDSPIILQNENLVSRPRPWARIDQEQRNQPHRALNQGTRPKGKRVRKKASPTYSYADYRTLGMNSIHGYLRQERPIQVAASGGASLSQVEGSQEDFLSDQEFPTALSMRGPGSRYEIIPTLFRKIGANEHVTLRRVGDVKMPVPLVRVTDVDLVEDSQPTSLALSSDRPSSRANSNQIAHSSTDSSQSTPATTRRPSENRDRVIDATRRALIQQMELTSSVPTSPVLQLHHRGHDLGFHPPSTSQRSVVEWLDACHQIDASEGGSEMSLASNDDAAVDEPDRDSVPDPADVQIDVEDRDSDVHSFQSWSPISLQAETALTRSSADVREFLACTEDLVRFESFENAVMAWLERVGEV